MPASKQTVIDSFRNEFGFLSNFHEASIWIDGERYRSVEHAYQAAKATDPVTKKMIRDAPSPGIAKRLGYACTLPTDWDDRKVELMRTLIREKFKNPLLRSMLLATDDVPLVHANTWNDRFWGVCKGVGQDWLGRILTEVRKECRQENE